MWRRNALRGGRRNQKFGDGGGETHAGEDTKRHIYGGGGGRERRKSHTQTHRGSNKGGAHLKKNMRYF